MVVGDALLDRDVVGTVERLSPDAPVPVVDQDAVRSRPGGAGLAAVLAAADAEDVTLVTALGDDAAGDEVRAMLAARGVGLVDLGMHGTTPEKIRIGPAGRPLLRLDRGAGGAIGDPDVAARSAIAWADAVLVADYGRGRRRRARDARAARRRPHAGGLGPAPARPGPRRRRRARDAEPRRGPRARARPAGRRDPGAGAPRPDARAALGRGRGVRDLRRARGRARRRRWPGARGAGRPRPGRRSVRRGRSVRGPRGRRARRRRHVRRGRRRRRPRGVGVRRGGRRDRDRHRPGRAARP